MEQEGGALIGTGSFGCVFNPSLKCPGEKENRDDTVSKLFFSSDSTKELNDEFKINSLIKGIKNYEEWSEIWYKKCKPPEYSKLYKEDPEVEDCIYENDINEYEFNKHRKMLQGKYAGVPLENYINKEFNKKALSNKDEFTRKFLKLMKCIKPLFIGLKEMYNKEISHNDIKEDNILISDGKCKYIDFGLSCEFKDRKFYEKRSKMEFLTDRIYPPYPYEFIYLYATPDVLKENDKEDLKYNINRSLHARYILIHESIFGRKTNKYLKDLVEKFIKDGKQLKNNNEGINITSLIDTYSLGMLIPSILCRVAKKNGKMKALKKNLTLNKVKSFMELFKVMTRQDNHSRENPIDAHDRFMELNLINLSNNKLLTKLNKRTKKRGKKRTSSKS